MVVDQLPRLGKRELICLLLFTCNYVVFVWRGFFFLWVLGMGYVILLWHSLSLPYNYFTTGTKRLQMSFYTLGNTYLKKLISKIEYQMSRNRHFAQKEDLQKEGLLFLVCVFFFAKQDLHSKGTFYHITAGIKRF